MNEMSDREKRVRFFLLGESSSFTADARSTIKWAQRTIVELEKQVMELRDENKGDDMTKSTDATNKINLKFLINDITRGNVVQFFQGGAYGEAVIWASERIAELEADSPMPESAEEIHQRRRREQMLDEVTLILIADGLREMNCTINEFGCGIRQSARKLCHGINEADATHSPRKEQHAESVREDRGPVFHQRRHRYHNRKKRMRGCATRV